MAAGWDQGIYLKNSIVPSGLPHFGIGPFLTLKRWAIPSCPSGTQPTGKALFIVLPWSIIQRVARETLSLLTARK
jgi:hypothetical protein